MNVEGSSKDQVSQAPEPTSYVVEGNTYRELIAERDRLRVHLRQKSEQITRLQDGIEKMQQGSAERSALPPAVTPIGTRTFTAAIRPDGELARFSERGGDPIILTEPGPFFAFNHSGARIVKVMIVEVTASSETKSGEQA